MAIVVNTNLSSINAQRNLSTVGKSLDISMQRLASGLRINTAADDAAGLAISNGMDSQIRGLAVATRNANDGLSVAGVAEGTLNTQLTILQRIRELAVQAASDTNSADNRTQIQQEITAQVNELTRLGNTTQFNGINLMDGSFSNKNIQVGAYAGQSINMTLADFRASGIGSIATATGTNAAALTNQAGGVSVNTIAAGGLSITAGTGATYTVGASSADGVSSANANASAIAKAAQINALSSSTGVTATANAAVWTADAGVVGARTTVAGDSLKINGVEILTAGLVVVASDTTNVLTNRINQFTGQTGVTATLNAGKLVLTASDGRNVNVVAGAAATQTMAGASALTTNAGGTITLTGNQAFVLASGGTGITDIGFTAATASVGINAGINVSTINVSGNTNVGASQAIQIVDSALKTVNGALASLGAISNRLNNTISNIAISSENLSASKSRIMDADFAVETANMTRAQIIQQSSVAVLSQANTRPQLALSLLGK